MAESVNQIILPKSLQCSDKEKLDGCNGIMLSPQVDRLFDRGFISFEDDGDPKDLFEAAGRDARTMGSAVIDERRPVQSRTVSVQRPRLQGLGRSAWV